MEAGPSPQGPEASIVYRKKTLELIFCIYFFPNKVMLAASHVGRAGSQRRPRPAEPTLPREAAGRPRLGLAFKVHCAEWQRLPRPAQASQHSQGPPAQEPSPDGASWSLQHRCTARPPGVPGPAVQAPPVTASLPPPPPQLPHCQQRVGSTPCTTLLRRSVCPSVRAGREDTSPLPFAEPQCARLGTVLGTFSYCENKGSHILCVANW